jgi:outer membrane protein assembly factor BamE (lipoprotein component of BamABCDE complex)
LAILVGSLVAGCAAQATTGAFTQTSRIESELKQGISTKMDVQRVLGTPKGSGSAVFPIDPRPREVWYYQDIEMTDATSEAGIFRVNVRQQILLVFFEKGVFDGFTWWSNAGEAKAE